MSAAVSTTTELATTDRLALATTGLEPSTAASLRATFVPFLDRAAEWEARAKAIVVTDVSQKREMKFARESRLALRDIRIAAENARKAAKADALSLSKAIDGAANIVKGIIEPLERHLLEQETFAERAEAAEQAKVCAARSETLRALGADPSVYTSLGEMADETWASILETATAARDAKIEAAKQEAAIRAEAERIAAEKREVERQERIKAEAERVAREQAAAEENARLRAEAAEREAAAKVERERVEAERAAERAKADEAAALAKAEKDRELAAAREETDKAARALAKAQAEAAQAKANAEQASREREAADAARAAAEADAAKPTKAKYALLVAALNKIAVWDEANLSEADEPHAAAKAREALEAVGLAPKAAKS